MKRFLKFLLVYLIVVVLGTLWHFAYDWLGESKYIAFLFLTNESLFEHLKLFFYPVMIVSVIQVLFIEENIGLFLMSRLYGALFSLITCVAFFYIYKYSVVKFEDIVFITSYFIIVFLVMFISFNIYNYAKFLPKYLYWIAYVLALATVIMFIYYSYSPLDNEIFIELRK